MSDEIRLVFGAGGIGKGKISHTWTTLEEVNELLSSLSDIGLNQLDSAASYPPGAKWVTETLLGQSKASEKGFTIDTKILVTGGNGAGHLSEKNIDASVEKSLELLGTNQVNILYSHGPDPTTPPEETARAYDKHYHAGRCKAIGLCNHSLAQLEEFINVCEEKGYTKPTVYQGEYHVLNRQIEKLMPLIRKDSMKVYAFGPLAGGFLTGKVSIPDPKTDLSKGRWGEGNFPAYPKTYDKPAIHSAFRTFYEVCQNHGITSTEASLRWLIHHSALKEGDALILGATRVDQLKKNVEVCQNGPLPEAVLDAAEKMWQDAQGAFDEGLF
ncbi:putative aldo/keto reductase [Xylogone sp. PMI_703]|nr:putative aldo/keto reductase [Xylogone sp. PMI_703]